MLRKHQYIAIFVLLEIFFHFIAFIPAAILIQLLVNVDNKFWLVFGIIFGIIIAKISYVILLGLVTAIAPKPKIGFLVDRNEMFKFRVLEMLSRLVRLSLVRQDYFKLPFPGKIYFTLAGAKLGKRCVIKSSDSVLVPYLFEMGDYSVLGENCVVSGHIAENDLSSVKLGKVKIGKNVMIGEDVFIGPDVVIEDYAVVQNKSNILPGTAIGEKQIWGGNPAARVS